MFPIARLNPARFHNGEEIHVFPVDFAPTGEERFCVSTNEPRIEAGMHVPDPAPATYTSDTFTVREVDDACRAYLDRVTPGGDLHDKARGILNLSPENHALLHMPPLEDEGALLRSMVTGDATGRALPLAASGTEPATVGECLDLVVHGRAQACGISRTFDPPHRMKRNSRDPMAIEPHLSPVCGDNNSQRTPTPHSQYRDRATGIMHMSLAVLLGAGKLRKVAGDSRKISVWIQQHGRTTGVVRNPIASVHTGKRPYELTAAEILAQNAIVQEAIDDNRPDTIERNHLLYPPVDLTCSYTQLNADASVFTSMPLARKPNTRLGVRA